VTLLLNDVAHSVRPDKISPTPLFPENAAKIFVKLFRIDKLSLSGAYEMVNNKCYDGLIR